jgi:hypothetical protein
MKTLFFQLLFTAAIVLSASVVQAEENATVLKSSDGPYLVSVCCFRGQDAAQRARNFSDELKTKHGIPSYLYDFDFARPGTSIALYAGDAKSPKDAELLRKRLKTLKLEDPTGKSRRPLAQSFWVTRNPLLSR